MSAQTEAPCTAADATDAPPTGSRLRRWMWRLAILAAVLVIAAVTTLIVKVSTEDAIGWRGGTSYLAGSGVVRHEDPFGAEPAGDWGEVAYQPGGTVTLGMTMTNISRTQVTVRSITFNGVAPVGGFTESSISKAVVGIDYRLDENSTDVQPFHPFQFPGGGYAYIQWTLTMCPSGTVEKDRQQEFSTFEIDYTYLGFHKHETLPLATPLRIDNEGDGCT
jgi:hypothetical protein